MITILKIGGSVLTDKRHEGIARPAEIARLAAEISAGPHGGLVLVHGAGSFGHGQAKEFALRGGLNGRSVRGIFPTHRAVCELNTLVVAGLHGAGVNAAPVHPLSAITLDDGRIDHICADAIRQMLAAGIVPVLHGDVAMDRSRGIDVLSGDQVVTGLAKALAAGRVGLGTNVDGVYGKDFKIISAITPATLGEAREALAGSAGVDVTGGMAGKVEELVPLAAAGVPSLIFNAERPGNVARFLRGEPVEGTVIRGD